MITHIIYFPSMFFFYILFATVLSTLAPPYLVGQTSFTVTRRGVPGVFHGDSPDSNTGWGIPLPPPFASNSATIRKFTITVSYPADSTKFNASTAPRRSLLGIPVSLLQTYAPHVPLGYDSVPGLSPRGCSDAAVNSLGVYAIVIQDTGEADDMTEYNDLQYTACQNGAVTISIDWHATDLGDSIDSSEDEYDYAYSYYVYLRTGDVLAAYDYVLSAASHHSSPLYGLIDETSPVGLVGHSFSGVSALLNTAGLNHGHGLNGFPSLQWPAQNLFKGVILLEPSDWYFNMSTLNQTAANNVSIMWFTSSQNQAGQGMPAFWQIFQSNGTKNHAFGFAINGTGHDTFAVSNCKMKGFYKNVNNTVINGQLYVAYPYYETYHQWVNAGAPFSNMVYFDQCDHSYNDTVPHHLVLNFILKYVQAFTRYVLLGDESYKSQFNVCSVAANTPAGLSLKYWSTNARQPSSQPWNPPSSVVANLQDCCGINFAFGACSLDEYEANVTGIVATNAHFYYVQNPPTC